MLNPRDTDARLRSDARAREMGCSTALAVMLIASVVAYVVWRIFFDA